jgi:general secretion pathway protein F
MIMPLFRYTALTSTGSQVSGSLEALSQGDAVQHVRNLGHLPISASRSSSGLWGRWRSTFRLSDRRPSSSELAIAMRELAALLGAGLEVDRAILVLTGMSELKSLNAPLTEVMAEVRRGNSLGDALESSRVFPNLIISMVRAGEIAGNLEPTLRRLAEYLTRMQAVRDAITSALIYPIVLIATAGASILFIMFFVLPEFQLLFEGSGESLPLVTSIVLSIGEFVRHFGWVLLVFTFAAIIYTHRRLKEPAFRRAWDGWWLRTPLFGKLIQEIEIERLCRTLAALISSGVALPVALASAADTLSNSVLRSAARETAHGLREGEGLADRMRQTGVLPRGLVDFVRLGEETGRLDEMLLRHADLQERSVKQTTERLLALLVPATTIVLGAIIAVLVASMVAAILSVNEIAM